MSENDKGVGVLKVMDATRTVLEVLGEKAPDTAAQVLAYHDQARDTVRELIEAAEAIRRPAAELAHEVASQSGFLSRGPVADHATGEVGPDYYAMTSDALQRLDAALTHAKGLAALQEKQS